MALRNMGRPQNLVSNALWMRMWRMYLVSAGVGMGGITSVSEMEIAPPGLTVTLVGFE